MHNNILFNELVERFPGLNIFENVKLSDYAFTKIGGKADILIIPNSLNQFIGCYKFILKYDIPITILGNISNVIILDNGIRGVSFILTEINDIITIEENIYAGCGVSLKKVNTEAIKNSLQGAEFASGIPGTVGGAVFMNAGAYGEEIKDIIEYVALLDRNGEVFIRYSEDFDFSFRYSNLQDEFFIVLFVKFKLKQGNIDEIIDKTNELTINRQNKQPLEYPSCGSVFKRPKNNFAGKLIQEAGMQGKRIGDAEVSLKHAGFIVNLGNASAKDYLELVKSVQEKVYETSGILLEPELRIIGE